MNRVLRFLSRMRVAKWYTHKLPKQRMTRIQLKNIKCYPSYQYQALPILPLLQYGSRMMVMLSGRLINRWWRNLPESEKAKIKMRIKRNSKVITGIVALFVGAEASVYYSHLEQSPYTDRRRLMLISNEDLIEILGDVSIEHLTGDLNVFPTNHPYYKSIKSIIDNLVLRNKERFPILSRPWKLVICDNNSVINAACLPTGEIIVFTGLINFVENQHQLAVVIAHELAHVVLEHGRETVSRGVFISVWMTILGFVLWTIVPGDIAALFSNWLKNKIIEIFLKLPHSRMLESEADVLGLEMISRGCFNVSEATRFWETMDIFEKSTGKSIPNWISTHPLSILRAKQLEMLTPAAIKLSEVSGCRDKFGFLRNLVDRYNFMKHQW